ncbi:alanyl-tRNA editing protein [Pseudoprimorskyibacter insulae]|uniref:Alanine--tRNA ligase n=1 Tax=Pseudoprimorskyibacter insulae TaxID=1695997 RepID=A0A2R8AW70_9RHOB|nr:alanyl-tRNA editing protein [Pseudoprimorskyibacter insulae]SPF80292.1 Alanine--tRNA ligase [Pseudoprimorskyibacter insulae]
MTAQLFQQDPYLREAPATVTGLTFEGGIVLDQTVFYATGGGQPGDSGVLRWGSQSIGIASAVKGDDGAIVLIPAEPARLPAVGTPVVQTLDWERRHRHMRMHTALHLLSVVIPLPVTGGAIMADRGRLDFMMPEPPNNKDALEDRLNMLIDRDMPVTEKWISEAELDANPGLVKTLSVKPPRGSGRVRLVQIGTSDAVIDIQPCGGTHVARTGEIGAIRIGKIENKGKQNRRVSLVFDA